MNFVGIIAEYDPFHSGRIAHAAGGQYHRGVHEHRRCAARWVPIRRKLRGARSAAPGDQAVALPAPYANASAEQFAAAGVHLLAALGVRYPCVWCRNPGASPLQGSGCRAVQNGGAAQASRKAARPFAVPPVPQPPKHCAPVLRISCPTTFWGSNTVVRACGSGAAMQLLPPAVPGRSPWHRSASPVQGAGHFLASHGIRQLVHTQGIKAASPFSRRHGAKIARPRNKVSWRTPKFSTAVLTLLRTKTPSS